MFNVITEVLILIALISNLIVNHMLWKRTDNIEAWVTFLIDDRKKEDE